MSNRTAERRKYIEQAAKQSRDMAAVQRKSEGKIKLTQHIHSFTYCNEIITGALQGDGQIRFSDRNNKTLCVTSLAGQGCTLAKWTLRRIRKIQYRNDPLNPQPR